MIVFYIPRVMANLMFIASQLYCLCGSSMVCLIRTLQLDAVSFLACGWMFASMDPIYVVEQYSIDGKTMFL